MCAHPVTSDYSCMIWVRSHIIILSPGQVFTLRIIPIFQNKMAFCKKNLFNFEKSSKLLPFNSDLDNSCSESFVKALPYPTIVHSKVHSLVISRRKRVISCIYLYFYNPLQIINFNSLNMQVWYIISSHVVSSFSI
jgi:hypothetical protein